MTRTRLILLLGCSLMVGLALTACAGAAASRFETGGQTVTGGPFLGWQMIAELGTQAEAQPVEASLRMGAHPLSMAHQIPASASEAALFHGGSCLGDD